MIFGKGHGTENDFVVLPDPAAELVLTTSVVTALCDRRRGLGADGVLRVVTAGAAVAAGILDRLPDRMGPGDWFMDYRNADGSVAQMCGNGVRVFAHYLRSNGLEDCDEFVVGSLAGPRPVVVHAADELSADVTVEMGTVKRLGAGWATVGGRRMTGMGVDVGNPHLACVAPALSAEELAALDVGSAVEFDRAEFPEGVNVEVADTGRSAGWCRCESTNVVSAKPGPAAPARWPRPSPRLITRALAPEHFGSGFQAGRSASRSPRRRVSCVVPRLWSRGGKSRMTGGRRRGDRRPGTSFGMRDRPAA